MKTMVFVIKLEYDEKKFPDEFQIEEKAKDSLGRVDVSPKFSSTGWDYPVMENIETEIMRIV